MPTPSSSPKAQASLTITSTYSPTSADIPWRTWFRSRSTSQQIGCGFTWPLLWRWLFEWSVPSTLPGKALLWEGKAQILAWLLMSRNLDPDTQSARVLIALLFSAGVRAPAEKLGSLVWFLGTYQAGLYHSVWGHWHGQRCNKSLGLEPLSILGNLRFWHAGFFSCSMWAWLPHDLWDLSSLTRDQTSISYSRSTGPAERSPEFEFWEETLGRLQGPCWS